ncbi:MAG: heat-inducible transcriptional repressor HrcA [Deltaproteobacteria bacterium]|nr:heat-inducible transcriptional repressor HrcA [Deltaproteobacteria bacterium]
MEEILSERNKNIIAEIINDFVLYGDPVGSVKIARTTGLGLSPASIRNAMSDLEEMGYLSHPHTSAGRVPTEKAYRYYVDSLLTMKGLSRGEKRTIESSFASPLALPAALHESSRLLSSLCNQMSIVMMPTFNNIIFKRIEFIGMGRKRLLAILISRTGLVINKVFDVESDVAGSDLEQINNYLNSILAGLSIREVKLKIVEEMRQERALYNKLLARALKLGADLVKDQPEGEFHVEGRANIFNQPEFADIGEMKRIFSTFEEKSILLDMLDRALKSEDLNVWIGDENGLAALSGLSLITSSYGTNDRKLGCIGVLGPTRMDYSRLIPIVSYTAEKLSNIIMED